MTKPPATPSRVPPAQTVPSSASVALHRLKPVSPDFHGAALPIYKASTVYFASPEAMRVAPETRPELYTYGLHGSPAHRDLAQQIAALEGGAAASLFPSGLAAIAHLNLSLLQHGDVVLLPHNVYSPSYELARSELSRFGIQHAFYDPLAPDSLRSVLTQFVDCPTKLVWLEAAGSITMEFPDLEALVAECRAAHAVCALDNTWGAGLAFNAFAVGVDYTVHALTKYPSGGADVLMGSIVSANAEQHLRITKAQRHWGSGVGAEDVFLVLRGLATMGLRYAQQDDSARRLAAWLATWPQVRQVLHPALSATELNGKHGEALSHANWRKTCTQYPSVRKAELGNCTMGDVPTGSAAALFSISLDTSITLAEIDQFVQNLQLFKLGYSWAGPVSLLIPYSYQQLESLRPQFDLKSHMNVGPLLRLSIGLEPWTDLQNDLAQAYSKIWT